MKGPQRQKQTQEQNKKECAGSVGLCQRHKPQHPHRVTVSLWEHKAEEEEEEEEDEEDKVYKVEARNLDGVVGWAWPPDYTRRHTKANRENKNKH